MDPGEWCLYAESCDAGRSFNLFCGHSRSFYIVMAQNDSVVSLSMTHQTKKKRVDDQSLPSDAGQRPIQLQRRRVWRACESCRCVSSPSSSETPDRPPPSVAKRSNAMETNPPALSVLLHPHNALGCRLRTERR
jgi:hypothetical protein